MAVYSSGVPSVPMQVAYVSMALQHKAHTDQNYAAIYCTPIVCACYYYH